MNAIPLQWIIVAAVVVIAMLALAAWSFSQKKSNPRGFSNGSVRNTAELSVTRRAHQGRIGTQGPRKAR